MAIHIVDANGQPVRDDSRDYIEEGHDRNVLRYGFPPPETADSLKRPWRRLAKFWRPMEAFWNSDLGTAITVLLIAMVVGAILRCGFNVDLGGH